MRRLLGQLGRALRPHAARRRSLPRARYSDSDSDGRGSGREDARRARRAMLAEEPSAGRRGAAGAVAGGKAAEVARVKAAADGALDALLARVDALPRARTAQ